MSDFWVNGIVSVKDKQAYIQLSNEKGMIAQLTMGQARTIAHQILVMASRSEMDAMVYRWFAEQDLPPNAAGWMMANFRDYRAEIDEEKVESGNAKPLSDDGSD